MRKRKFTTQFLTQRFVLEKINCSTLKCNKNHDIVHKYKYNYLTIKKGKKTNSSFILSLHPPLIKLFSVASRI